MITVLISTTHRLAYLRNALESVRMQTALDQVERVIVSENSGIPGSEGVCAEFKDQPITYKFRDPPLDPLYHLPTLLDETTSDYVAILHDDDWWHPSHLANGLRSLLANPDASSYWTAYFRVLGESSIPMVSNSMLWGAAGFPELTRTWKLGQREILLACLAHSPCHYSTLIARKHELGEGCRVYITRNNLHDNDRLLLAELAKGHAVLYQPVPEAFIRMHNQQDGVVRPAAERSSYVQATTDLMLEACQQLGLRVDEELASMLENCPAQFKYYLCGSFDPVIVQALARRGMAPPALLRHIKRERLKGFAKTFAKSLLLRRA
jgi:hypothetical protein